MNVHDEMSDNDVLQAASDSLSAIPVAEAPDADAIMARGRARRHRRMSGLAGLAVAGTAATAGVALGLAGVFGAGGPAPAGVTGRVRTAAFTLVKNDNGTATLTLNQHQMFDPSTLQRALARDGIPALVKIGTNCSSHPSPPSPGRTGALSVQLPGGVPAPKSYPGHPHPFPAGDVVTVINPSAIPAGTELFFDYVNHNRGLMGGLIYTKAYTCTSGTPAGQG